VGNKVSHLLFPNLFIPTCGRCRAILCRQLHIRRKFALEPWYRCFARRLIVQDAKYGLADLRFCSSRHHNPPVAARDRDSLRVSESNLRTPICQNSNGGRRGQYARLDIRCGGLCEPASLGDRSKGGRGCQTASAHRRARQPLKLRAGLRGRP